MLTKEEKQKKAEEESKRDAASLMKFKSTKPKRIPLVQNQLVKTADLQAGRKLPLLIQPTTAHLDLVEWVKDARAFVEEKLLEHGAILLRGFVVGSLAEFEQFAAAVCGQLFDEYGDLPRARKKGKVYQSTPYPSTMPILFHNESSHLYRWPMKILFFCVQEPKEGGETPIVDCREIYQRLAPKTREKFEQKGLLYIRNFIEGFDISWADFFKTTDRQAVEESCRKANMEFQWKGANNLVVQNACKAVNRHPKTGERVFFNQIMLHHVACLDASVREFMSTVVKEEDLPRSVYYGDGTPIEAATVEAIQGAYEQAKVSFKWEKGDILLLDNMLVSHSRNPYVGAREIVVAMGDLIDCEQVSRSLSAGREG